MGNVENEKVMCTIFSPCLNLWQFIVKFIIRTFFITLLCFKVGSYYTTQADLYLVQAGFELMILTLPPMGAAILACSPKVFDKETIRAQFYDITI